MFFIRRIWSIRLVRFLCVGVFNTLFDLTLFNIFISVFKLPAVVANTISVTIAVSVSYVLNNTIVFTQPLSEMKFKKYVVFFVITGFSSIVIQAGVILLITHLVKIDPLSYTDILGKSIKTQTIELNIAKMIAVVVGMVWNFTLYKLVVFKNPDAKKAGK